MKLELEQSDLDKITDDIILSVTSALIPKLEVMLKASLVQDMLLTKKQVYKEILNCTPETAEEIYFCQPDFPVFDTPERLDGTKTQRRYSRKAIEQWIATRVKAGGDQRTN